MRRSIATILRRVYPRVCGGTSATPLWTPATRRLSPRMRGNLCEQRPCAGWLASIPAYAGEPDSLPELTRQASVYPRVCEGTTNIVASVHSVIRLSPRMRGKLPTQPYPAAPATSIPAYAGEPPNCCLIYTLWCVYPRVCGGTQKAMMKAQVRKRLSPRMRGNRRPYPASGRHRGSIPAYAGEPPANCAVDRTGTVYPRVCGGTQWGMASPDEHEVNLSPRMRGNPGVQPGGGLRHPSIPTYAGKSSYTAAAGLSSGVYPRVCGGTVQSDQFQRHAGRLSPRMRGNRLDQGGKGG